MKLLIITFAGVSLICCKARADCGDLCPPKLSEHQQEWKNRLRLKALKRLDQFLGWSTSDALKAYAIDYALQEELLHNTVPEMKIFADNYGYFSAIRPIISRVSSDPEDLELTCCLLKGLYEKGGMEIAAAEVLVKALAYRDLKEGQGIKIPTEQLGKIIFERFTVDRIFNLWNGMPAFGLLPDRKSFASILLFRGTDFSLDSRRSFASVLSDLELAGPGLFAFRKAQSEIDLWLKKVNKEGKAAKVMGFSLGGALAAYTFIYENEWLAETGSIAFCAPGLTQPVIEDWQLLSKERQKGFISYVNTGDIISKAGKLFGIAYCLSTDRPLEPLTAHTILMSSEASFTKARVDIVQENARRQ